MEHVLLYQDGKRTIVKSQEYSKESELQEIIKNNPDLINLSSIFGSPIMVIGRESENIDVLAITADAVPVVIECKRKDNPDMRYLIAQVFEYASKLNKKEYNEFDQMVTKYFASDRCEENQYKNLSLKEAFLKFQATIPDLDEAYDESEFIDDLSDNLKNGEFYLIMVVDKISDVTYQTVEFLNSKMNKLRVEIIEVSKFSDISRTIYVPKHINREGGRKGETPGKTTFDEMLKECGTKEAGYIKEIKTLWEGEDDFEIVMGTKGFSARYKDIPILWILPDYIQLAPRIKRKYEHFYDPLSKMIEKYFNKGAERRIKFISPDFTSDKLKLFIAEVKSFWKESWNLNEVG